jgi:hypothetical protein
MKPQDALSPRNRLDPTSLDVIFTSKNDWWSLATMTWDGQSALGIRWNGDINDPDDKGNPRSHGQGTWFVLPDEISFFASAFVDAIKSQDKAGKAKQAEAIAQQDGASSEG